MQDIKNLPPIANSDHCIIYFKYMGATQINNKCTKYFYKNFNKIDYFNLKLFIRNFLFHNDFTKLNAIQSWKYCSFLFDMAIKYFVPTEYFIKFKKSTYTTKQFHLFSRMKRYYIKFRKTGIAKFKEKYKFFKQKYTSD